MGEVVLLFRTMLQLFCRSPCACTLLAHMYTQAQSVLVLMNEHGTKVKSGTIQAVNTRELHDLDLTPFVLWAPCSPSVKWDSHHFPLGSL